MAGRRPLALSERYKLGERWGATTVLVVLPLAAAFSLTWWAVGDQSDPGGYVQLIPLPGGSGTASTAMFVAGLVTGVAFAFLMWRLRWHSTMATDVVTLCASSLIVGALMGFGLRALSATTYGANIGGGLVLILGPLLGGPFVYGGYRSWRQLVDDREARVIEPSPDSSNSGRDDR